MKIGILTFHRAINYGAVLQCYALYKTLEEMGHEVEVVDYRPEYIEKYRRYVSWYDVKREQGVLKKLRRIASGIKGIPDKRDSNRRFDDFLNKNFKFSARVNKPEDMPQYYDVIVFGSDQIWSPQICNGFDKIYWGQFPHRSTTRLITYAASLGGHNMLADTGWKQVGEMIQAFDCVSVREKGLQEDLRKRVGVESTLVVDPSVLAEEKIYDAIAEEVLQKDYILVFSVAPTKDLMGFAEGIAEQTHSKMVKIQAIGKPKVMNKDRKTEVNIMTPSVGEFLGLFKKAKCVVTVSFHGTAFSVIMRRSFYSLHNYMQDRAEQLLHSIGMENRLVPSENQVEFSEADYSGAEEKIRRIRKEAREWLDAALN